jgi:hypothetical protein
MKHKNYLRKSLLLFLVCSAQFITAQVPNYVPTNGLMAWWPFDGNANDLSGGGNNLSTIGSVTYSTDRNGMVNGCALFNSSSEYFSKTNANLPSGNSSRSISIWYNGTGIIYNTLTGGSCPFMYGDLVNGGCYKRFGFFNGSSTYNTMQFHGKCNPVAYSNLQSHLNAWHQIVFTYNGTNKVLSLYQDGVLFNTTTLAAANATTLNELRIGSGLDDQNPVGNISQFDGKIDDIGVWNRVLTQQEITNLYNAVNCNVTATTTQTNVTCNSGTNGSATVTAAGGTAPYAYSWAPSGGTSATASSLAAGTYTCTIGDANQCSITNTVSITEPLPLTITVTPLINNIQTGSNANFNAASQDPTANISWQTKHQGLQWQSIQNSSFYTGVTTNTLTVNAVQLNNHLQSFRAIASKGICSDTSSSTILHISDTCIVTVNDTNFVTVTDTNYINQTVYDTTFVSITDTNYVTIYDTVTTYISVTDTLFIDINTVGLNNNSIINTIKVFPNPSNSILNLNYGNYATLNNFRVKITNALGSIIYDQAITQPSEILDLSTFGGAGIYYLNIINPQGNIIEVRKIVLQ